MFVDRLVDQGRKVVEPVAEVISSSNLADQVRGSARIAASLVAGLAIGIFPSVLSASETPCPIPQSAKIEAAISISPPSPDGSNSDTGVAVVAVNWGTSLKHGNEQPSKIISNFRWVDSQSGGTAQNPTSIMDGLRETQVSREIPINPIDSVATYSAWVHVRPLMTEDNENKCNKVFSNASGVTIVLSNIGADFRVSTWNKTY